MVCKPVQTQNRKVGECVQKSAIYDGLLHTPIRRQGSKGKKSPSGTLPRWPWIEGGKLVGMRLDGQPYRFIGLRPYQRVDGSMTELSIWSTECAECREPFEASAPVTATTFSPSRRCAACAKAGKRVAGDRS